MAGGVARDRAGGLVGRGADRAGGDFGVDGTVRLCNQQYHKPSEDRPFKDSLEKRQLFKTIFYFCTHYI